jgi:hypothetical protein
MAGVRFAAREIDFFLFHSVQTGSEAHPASYPIGTADPFWEGKRPGRKDDHSPPSSAEIKNGLNGMVHRDNFHFL